MTVPSAIRPHHRDVVAWVLLLALCLSVLWKGGKSLDATWVLGFCAVGLVFLGRESRRIFSPVWYGWAAFLLVSALSFAFSSTMNYGLDEILRDASIFLIFCRVAGYEDRARIIGRFARILTATALIAVLIGAIVYVLQPVNRFVGTFFDWRFHTDYWPNAWADLVLLSWPVAAYTLRRRPVWAGLSIGALLGSLLLSFSRGGMLSVVAQAGILCVIGVWLVARRHLHIKTVFVRKMLTTCVIAFSIALGFFVSANAIRSTRFDVESFSNKATFTASEGKSSVSERQSFWNAAMAMTKEKPLLGWGPYSFRFVQPRFQEGVLATADHPHNVLLKIASERGLVALALFIVMLASALVPAKLQLLGPGRQRVDAGREWIVTVLISVSGVFIHSMIDFNLQFVGIALPFWVLIATVVPGEKGKAGAQFISERLLAVLLGIVLLIEGIFLFTSSLGRHAQVEGRIEDAAYWYELSQPEIFSRDLLPSLAALQTGRGDVDGAMQTYDTYARINPVDARAWLMRGNTLELQGDADGALAAYDIAWQYGRYNMLNILSGYMRIALLKNDRQTLALRREEFLSLFREYAGAIKQNTHFIALSGAVEELEHVAQHLARAYPDQAPVIVDLLDEAVKNADAERAKYQERSAGLLW